MGRNPTMGEAWHNNHHAYPGSARIGLLPGQSDWGYAFVRLCERLGLVWDVRTADTMGERPGLSEVPRHGGGFAAQSPHGHAIT